MSTTGHKAYLLIPVPALSTDSITSSDSSRNRRPVCIYLSEMMTIHCGMTSHPDVPCEDKETGLGGFPKLS